MKTFFIDEDALKEHEARMRILQVYEKKLKEHQEYMNDIKPVRYKFWSQLEYEEAVDRWEKEFADTQPKY